MTILFSRIYTHRAITFGIDIMGQIKVLVGHRNPVFSEGLSRLLADEEDIEVVAIATNGEETVRKAKEVRPDVVIIDIDMTKLNGIEAAKQIKKHCPATAILMLSEYHYGTNVLPSLRAGALGYLLESCPLGDLISAIHSVHAGEEVFAPKAAADVLHRLAARQDEESEIFEGLHSRELEILKLVCKGMPNRDIANELTLSERTVSTHLVNIFRKLRVSSRTEAVVQALKKGLVNLNDLD